MAPIVKKAALWGVLGGGVIATVALAQPAGSALEAIVAGDGDEQPLANSLQVAPADLRLDTGFERLYRLPTARGDMFARVDGGLTAVFPRSQYGATEQGEVALIPAGTTWVIGQPDHWLAQREGLFTTQAAPGTPAPVSPMRIDLRARVSRPGDPVAPPPAPLIDLPSSADATTQDVSGIETAELADAELDALIEGETDATPWADADARADGIRTLLTRAADACRDVGLDQSGAGEEAG